MSPDNLFTVDQVAQMLEMHPRTIRRYIRDGKLKATKVGGEWRLREADLEGLFKGGAEEMVKQSEADILGFIDGRYSEFDGKVQVCAIVDYHVGRQEDAQPMAQALISLMNSGDPDQHNARFQYNYVSDEGKARFVLWGNPRFLSKMLAVAGEYC